MKNTKTLEMLAVLTGIGVIASIQGDLMREFSRQIKRGSNYNPTFDSRNIRKISNLKYARHPVYAKNPSFYQNKV